MSNGHCGNAFAVSQWPADYSMRKAHSGLRRLSGLLLSASQETDQLAEQIRPVDRRLPRARALDLLPGIDRVGE